MHESPWSEVEQLRLELARLSQEVQEGRKWFDSVFAELKQVVNELPGCGKYPCVKTATRMAVREVREEDTTRRESLCCDEDAHLPAWYDYTRDLPSALVVRVVSRLQAKEGAPK